MRFLESILEAFDLAARISAVGGDRTDPSEVQRMLVAAALKAKVNRSRKGRDRPTPPKSAAQEAAEPRTIEGVLLRSPDERHAGRAVWHLTGQMSGVRPSPWAGGD